MHLFVLSIYVFGTEQRIISKIDMYTTTGHIQNNLKSKSEKKIPAVRLTWSK